MSLRIADLPADQVRKLNSATQYPSILTYHALGERARLTEERTTEFDEVVVTEKIDGTNARIVIPPLAAGAPLIGSRTELLHHLPDMIFNPAQGIVEAIKPIARRIADELADDDFVVVFGEVYGGKVGSGAKNYSTSGAVGFRVFDIARVPLDVLDLDIAAISAWRESGGQTFLRTDELADAALRSGLPQVPELAVAAPPEGLAATHEWLTSTIARTHAALDTTGQLRPEGVVVRSKDRSRIAKIRFEDYERTAKAHR